MRPIAMIPTICGEHHDFLLKLRVVQSIWISGPTVTTEDWLRRHRDVALGSRVAWTTLTPVGNFATEPSFEVEVTALSLSENGL